MPTAPAHFGRTGQSASGSTCKSYIQPLIRKVHEGSCHFSVYKNLKSVPAFHKVSFSSSIYSELANVHGFMIPPFQLHYHLWPFLSISIGSQPTPSHVQSLWLIVGMYVRYISSCTSILLPPLVLFPPPCCLGLSPIPHIEFRLAT